MDQTQRVLYVKSLLGGCSLGEDGAIDLALQAVENQILAYINWDSLPPQLENILILMTVSYMKSAGLGESGSAVGPVSSVKRGNVQTTFAVAAGASGSAGTFNLGADNGDFFGWRQVLNQYRKLRW